MAVSKFHPAGMIEEAFAAGQRIFGESRAQELTAKAAALPKEIEWHFIGPLQSNKVKEIAPFVHTIHSIDSEKLLQEVEKQAARNNRSIRVLIEVHIAQEEAKHGFSPAECHNLFRDMPTDAYPHLRFCGLMGMATNTDDENLIQQEFHTLHTLFDELRNTTCKENPDFRELSMGMSDDYPIAIREGSTLIRVGTSIFGDREY